MSGLWGAVEVDEFRPGNLDAALLARIGVERGRPVALFVGVDRPMKGPVTAARVARRMTDLTWIVVGRPSARLDFGTGRVIRLDAIPRAEMAPLLRSVDVVLTPGVYEPFGILAAEALASGTPIVTGPSGLADLVLRGAGSGSWCPTQRTSLPSNERQLRRLKTVLRSTTSSGRSGIRSESCWRRQFGARRSCRSGDRPARLPIELGRPRPRSMLKAVGARLSSNHQFGRRDQMKDPS